MLISRLSAYCRCAQSADAAIVLSLRHAQSQGWVLQSVRRRPCLGPRAFPYNDQLILGRRGRKSAYRRHRRRPSVALVAPAHWRHQRLAATTTALRGWRFSRCVSAGDAAMGSEDNRRESRRSGGQAHPGEPVAPATRSPRRCSPPCAPRRSSPATVIDAGTTSSAPTSGRPRRCQGSRELPPSTLGPWMG